MVPSLLQNFPDDALLALKDSVKFDEKLMYPMMCPFLVAVVASSIVS